MPDRRQQYRESAAMRHYRDFTLGECVVYAPQSAYYELLQGLSTFR